MARSLNKVMIIGHVADEPAVRPFANGGKVANISVATNEWSRGSTDENGNQSQGSEVTEWHRISLWNRLADIAESYVHKGSRVYIEGKLRTRSYVDKQNIKRYSTEILADNIILLDSRQAGEAGGYHNNDQYQNGGGNRNWGDQEGGYGTQYGNNMGQGNGSRQMGNGGYPQNNYGGGQGNQMPPQHQQQPTSAWGDPRQYSQPQGFGDPNMGGFGNSNMQNGMNNMSSYNGQGNMSNNSRQDMGMSGGFNKGPYSKQAPASSMDSANTDGPAMDNSGNEDEIPF